MPNLTDKDLNAIADWKVPDSGTQKLRALLKHRPCWKATLLSMPKRDPLAIVQKDGGRQSNQSWNSPQGHPARPCKRLPSAAMQRRNPAKNCTDTRATPKVIEQRH